MVARNEMMMSHCTPPRLPWPMELSSRLDVLGPGDSFRNLEHRLRMIRSQQLDYAEHGIDAPPELERLAKRALVIGDEMTTGLPVESARAHTTVHPGAIYLHLGQQYVVRALDREQLEPASLVLREPTLDDVFLTLTGKRAEEVPAEDEEEVPVA